MNHRLPNYASKWQGGIAHFTRVFRTYMSASLATMFQYRGEIVLWAAWGVVYPAVAMSMWRAAIAGSADGREIRGFEAGDFAAYFLLTMVVGHAATAWDVFEMGYMVRTGRMSPKLLRPILPVWERVADNLAYKALTLVVLIPLWAIAAWISHPHFTTTAGEAVIGIISLVIGSAINFIWNYNLGILAFWVTRMDAISQLWLGMSLFLGGRLAPLGHLPNAVQWVAAVLPFKWVIWFPSATLMGSLGPGEIAIGLLGQAIWLAAGIAAFRWLWRSGVRQYSAVGA